MPGADPERRLAVCAVVRNPAGRYLMVRRAAAIRAPGYWTPVTGRPEGDEALSEAAAREVREETGLAVEVGAEVHRCPAEGAPFTLVWFEARAASDALRIDRSELADARWLTLDEVLDLRPMFDATRRFFEAQRRKSHPAG